MRRVTAVQAVGRGRDRSSTTAPSSSSTTTFRNTLDALTRASSNGHTSTPLTTTATTNTNTKSQAPFALPFVSALTEHSQAEAIREQLRRADMASSSSTRRPLSASSSSARGVSSDTASITPSHGGHSTVSSNINTNNSNNGMRIGESELLRTEHISTLQLLANVQRENKALKARIKAGGGVIKAVLIHLPPSFDISTIVVTHVIIDDILEW
jgi:hypothetical protein